MTKVTITITKSYPRLRLAPISVTLDALERRKRPLAKVNKNSGAHQKNFNEDRPISLGKCRAMHLFAINIKCMQICVGVPSEKVHLPPIPAPITPKCTCFHFLLILRLTDRDSPPLRVSPRPLEKQLKYLPFILQLVLERPALSELAGCWPCLLLG